MRCGRMPHLRWANFGPDRKMSVWDYIARRHCMLNRREAIAATAAGLTALTTADEKNAPVPARDGLKVTRLETFLVQPRWLFLKVHTDAGIVGLGEPIVEGRAETVAAAVKEIEPYLVGKDPRQVVHHWQAIYRNAFYRGGPVLTRDLIG